MANPVDRKPRRRRVLRLAILYAMSVCAITALLLGLLYRFTGEQLYAQIDAGLDAEARALGQLEKREGRQALVTTVAARAGDWGPLVEVAGARLYALVDPAGRRLAGDFATWPSTISAAAMQPLTIHVNRGELPQRGTDLIDDIRAVTLRLPDGSRLLVGQALNEVKELKGQAFLAILLSLAVVAATAVIGARLLASRIQNHLLAVSDTARAVMDGELSRRIQVPLKQSDEFDELSLIINAMIERIEQLVTSLRVTTVNVAHDLRSPVSRMRSRLELLQLRRPSLSEYSAAVSETIAETDRILRVFQAILDIAQIETGAADDKEVVNLSELCQDLRELYAPMADERGVELSAARYTEVLLHGSRELLAQAISNLLDNAIKYSPAGGKVRFDAIYNGAKVDVVVADQGPGIPEKDRARVLDPFVRLDESRSTPGNGLGLALVRAIANRCGAALYLLDNRPGLCVVLRFSRQRPELATASDLNEP